MTRVYTFVVNKTAGLNGSIVYEATCPDFEGFVSRSTSIDRLVTGCIVDDLLAFWLDGNGDDIIDSLPQATSYDDVYKTNPYKIVFPLPIDDKLLKEDVVVEFHPFQLRVHKWVLKALFSRFLDCPFKSFSEYLVYMFRASRK